MQKCFLNFARDVFSSMKEYPNNNIMLIPLVRLASYLHCIGERFWLLCAHISIEETFLDVRRRELRIQGHNLPIENTHNECSYKSFALIQYFPTRVFQAQLFISLFNLKLAEV